MTPQKAYNECKNFFENDGIGELDGVAFNMALNALEKHIPKKPVCRLDIHTNTPTGFCPVCSLLVHENITEKQTNTNYCRFCGQALDWSDTE